MQFYMVQQILGLLLTMFSLTMLVPAAVALGYGDEGLRPFLTSFIVTLVAGLALWIPVRTLRKDLRLRDGFVIVTLFWVVLGLSGAIPLMISEHPHMRFTDAVFEAVSGLTTTGATVLTGLDKLPPSILYYRAQLQWLGGMGVVVLAVAILPMLGVGGMQLYRAETPGPMKDSKLTPRITETAKALWYVYAGLTVVCAVAYWLAGMSAFDAITHSFSTVATGGFSTHDASIAYFNSPLLVVLTTLFMFLAGISFALHFLAWRGRTLRAYIKDTEARTYAYLLLVASIITAVLLYGAGTYTQPSEALLHAAFQVVSVGTSTGFLSADYPNWPGVIPVFILFIGFVGGCAGSTSGGIKVIRCLLLFKQGMREIARLIHPNAMIPVRVGKQVLPESVVSAVWGFFALYVASFSLILLAVMATGLDQVTAFSAVTSTMNNIGVGLGTVGSNYAGISSAAKWILCFAMLLGRLEIFTLLVLVAPAFWRK